MKVIFHILELNKWQTNVQNIRDLISSDPEAEVEVIVGSDATSLLVNTVVSTLMIYYVTQKLTSLFQNLGLKITTLTQTSYLLVFKLMT